MQKANVILMAIAVMLVPTQAMLNGSAMYAAVWDVSVAILLAMFVIYAYELNRRLNPKFELFISIQLASFVLHFLMYNLL